MAPCYIAVQPSAEQHSCALLGHSDVTSKADCAAAFKYTQAAAGYSISQHKNVQRSLARMLLVQL